jgi:hypothetical protein
MMARRPGHPADQARSGQIAADRVLDVTRFGLPLRLFAAPQPRLGCCPPLTAVPTGEHDPRPGLDDLAERSQVPGSTAPYPTPGPVPARTGPGRRQPAPRAPTPAAPAAPGRSPLRPRSPPPSSPSDRSSAQECGRTFGTWCPGGRPARGPVSLPPWATAWHRGEHPRHAPPPPGNAAPRCIAVLRRFRVESRARRGPSSVM